MKHNFIGIGTFIVVFLVVISIFKAKSIHDQSILSGLLANSSYLYCFASFVFWKQIKHAAITKNKIWRIIIIMVWINAIYLAIFSVFEITYDYVSPLSENVLGVNSGKISKVFLMFGLIYYFVLAITKKRPFYFFCSLILAVITQLFDIQRGFIILIFLIYILIFFTYRKTLIIKKSLLVLPVVFISFIIFSSNFEEITSAVDKKFDGVFELLTPESNHIDDASVRIRVVQTAYALHKFKEHPLFGNGNLRSSYQKEILSSLYFYPADIGIFGVLYLYGIMGVLIFVMILFVLRNLYKKMNKKDTIEMTIYFYLISLVLTTIKDANIFIDPDIFFFLMLVLFFMNPLNSLSKEKINGVKALQVNE